MVSYSINSCWAELWQWNKRANVTVQPCLAHLCRSIHPSCTSAACRHPLPQHTGKLFYKNMLNATILCVTSVLFCIDFKNEGVCYNFLLRSAIKMWSSHQYHQPLLSGSSHKNTRATVDLGLQQEARICVSVWIQCNYFPAMYIQSLYDYFLFRPLTLSVLSKQTCRIAHNGVLILCWCQPLRLHSPMQRPHRDVGEQTRVKFVGRIIPPSSTYRISTSEVRTMKNYGWRCFIHLQRSWYYFSVFWFRVQMLLIISKPLHTEATPWTLPSLSCFLWEIPRCNQVRILAVC